MSTTSPQRPTLSLRKKLVFSVVAVFAILGAAEVGLWVIGVERLIEREDPFRGFSGLIEVFEPAGDVYRTRPAVAATFNDQSFARAKSADGLRIFTLGGSSAYGFPWGAPAAFTAILGDVLTEAHPDLAVEAVNVAGVSYAMHRLNLVLDELVTYDPDIFIVYSGHNEFIEPEFFDALKRRSATRNRVEYALAHSRVYSGLHAMSRSVGASERAVPRFGAEVRRDRSRRFDNAEKDAIVTEFRFRLERLVRKAQDAGSHVVLVTVPANLRDWRPEASVVDVRSKTGSDAAPGDEWRWAFQTGKNLLDRRQFAEALAEFERASALAPGHAGTRFFIGRSYEGLGQWEQAQAAYERACDLDASPSRRVSGINDAIRAVARDEGALLVDADRLFAEASANGLVGFNLIEDYVHPTVAGHQLLAWHLWQAIETAGWLEAGQAPRRELFDAALTKRGPAVDPSNPAWLYNQGVVLENQGQARQAMDKYRQALALAPDHGGARGNLARLLVQSGNYDEARPLAERLVADYPERKQFAIVLGVILLNQGDLAGARTRFETVLAADPDDALAHHNLGRVLERQGDDGAARQHFEQALAARNDLATFHYRHGQKLYRAGDLARAYTHLSFAARAPSGSGDAHYLAGQLAARAGDTATALRHFGVVVAREPEHTGALVRGAWIKATATDPRLRDTSTALEWAQRAAEQTRFLDAASLDTLAAANAAAGLFDEAVRREREAIALAPEQVRPQLRARLELYTRGQAYFEGTAASGAPNE